MKLEFTSEDLIVIRESLDYSKKNVEEAKGTPNEVRRQNLERINRVREKLFERNIDSKIN